MNQEQFNQFVCEFAYQIILHNNTVSDEKNLEIINSSIMAAKYYMPEEIRLMIYEAIFELNKKS
jgi:hypothetical protein